MSLTTNQLKLIAELIPTLPIKGANTHQLAKRMNHKQAYETSLKRRLKRLKEKDILKEIVTLSDNGYVKERIWMWTSLGFKVAMSVNALKY